MTIGGIKAGDIVFVEKKQGWKFYAHVEGREGKELLIKPFNTGGPIPSYRHATSREIKKHWKQTKQPSARPKEKETV